MVVGQAGSRIRLTSLFLILFRGPLKKKSRILSGGGWVCPPDVKRVSENALFLMSFGLIRESRGGRGGLDSRLHGNDNFGQPLRVFKWHLIGVSSG